MRDWLFLRALNTSWELKGKAIEILWCHWFGSKVCVLHESFVLQYLKGLHRLWNAPDKYYSCWKDWQYLAFYMKIFAYKASKVFLYLVQIKWRWGIKNGCGTLQGDAAEGQSGGLHSYIIHQNAKVWDVHKTLTWILLDLKSWKAVWQFVVLWFKK